MDLFSHGPVDESCAGQSALRVALTFDTEHPEYPASPGNTARVLDLCGELGVPATFFVQGQWASAHPELVARIAAEGHVLGNHSQWHVPASVVATKGLRDSVRRAETAIIAASGMDPKPWFRGPYGHGLRDLRVRRCLRRLGYIFIGWDVEARDYVPGIDRDEVVERVCSGCLRHGDGARVLLHDWPDVTAVALEPIVDRLRREGVTLVAIPQVSLPV